VSMYLYYSIHMPGLYKKHIPSNKNRIWFGNIVIRVY